MSNHSHHNHNCTICCDTGIDQVFGGDCSYCTEAGQQAASRFIAKGIGENVDRPRTSGPTRGDTRASASKSVRRNKYAAACVTCGQRVEAEAGVLSNERGKWVVRHEGSCPAVTAPAAARAAEMPTSGVDLRNVPSGRYIAPGGERKFQIDNVTSGKWADWVFVKNGSEYGAGNKYGSQRPGQDYRGDHAEELAKIAADPEGAAAEYGRQTNHCGLCGRLLENEESVERGIGPVCARKAGW